MIVKFDTRMAEKNFGIAVDTMAKLTGFDRRGIIRAEAGSILKACAKATKVATQAKIVRGARLRAIKGLGLTRGGPVTVNAGYKTGIPYGRVYVKNRSSGKWFRTHDENFLPRTWKIANWAWLNAQIAPVAPTVQRALAAAKASAGLARGSWVLIGDSLGIRLEDVPGGSGISAGAISKARAAKARMNAQTNNGASQTEDTNGRFTVTLINRLPYGAKIGFGLMLMTVVSGRAQFMYTAVAKGFNNSLEQTARLFPGWVIKKAA